MENTGPRAPTIFIPPISMLASLPNHILQMLAIQHCVGGRGKGGGDCITKFKVRNVGPVPIYRWVLSWSLQTIFHDVVALESVCQLKFNLFTPENDQVQISSAASPVILHDSMTHVGFIAHLDGKRLYYYILIVSLINFSIKGWDNVLFKLGNETP